MTKELLLKYIDGRCNPREKIRAEDWLRNCSPEELDLLMLQVWDDKDNPSMPAAEADKLWKKLSLTVDRYQLAAKVISMSSLRKWAVAVAALAILAIGITWASQKKQARTIVRSAPQAETQVIDWVYVTNTDVKEKLVILEDSSELWLFPKSTLTYQNPFGDHRRDLFLDGKALFRVAKDADRPFTVYSGNLATTALGTKFLVDASDKNTSIQVKLYEGKVVVKTGEYPLKTWTRQDYLLPGDELSFSTRNQLSVIRHTKQKEVKENHIATKPAKELLFTNEELYIVFEKIIQQYKVNIKYNKADIKGMYFTGSISQNGALGKSLQVITQMNGLGLKEDRGKYIIRKTE